MENKIKQCSGSVYNAFIMPFDKHTFCDEEIDPVISIGVATSEWKDNNLPYQNVVGIMVDVKYLMQKTSRQDYKEMLKLSEVIQEEMRKHYG